MHQIQLTDEVYAEVERRAAEAGYNSIDEYVAEMLMGDLNEETANFDHLFTPECIADLDRVSAEVRASGITYSPEQVREHFRNKSEAWSKESAR